MNRKTMVEVKGKRERDGRKRGKGMDEKGGKT